MIRPGDAALGEAGPIAGTLEELEHVGCLRRGGGPGNREAQHPGPSAAGPQIVEHAPRNRIAWHRTPSHRIGTGPGYRPAQPDGPDGTDS